ncbi:MAG: helix-turn-helix domain-containing protein [Alphaproteobacteria bacterium]|nr:helix-turn-helix domain-containing protein [Alphaproteobacteria bacterium]
MTAQATPPTRPQAIHQIRQTLIEKKMTQAELADASDCHEKTIQNLLGGRTVRDQTLFDVCMVLGLDFDELKRLWSGVGRPGNPASDEPGQPVAGSEIAPIYMGAYTRAAVDHMIGQYLTLRPAFTASGTIIAYRTDISWDENWPSLLFEERNRPDAPYSHRGRLHVPPSSSFIHLVSLTKGAMRMIVVSQLDQTKQMRGIITTLSKNGATIAPVSAPIVYLRLDEPAAATFGEITEQDEAFAGYRERLATCLADGYVSLVGI